MKKRKNLGCNYGLRMMVMVAVFFIDGGNNSLQMLVDCWLGVSEVIDIMDWMGKLPTRHNNQQFNGL